MGSPGLKSRMNSNEVPSSNSWEWSSSRRGRAIPGKVFAYLVGVTRREIHSLTVSQFHLKRGGWGVQAGSASGRLHPWRLEGNFRSDSKNLRTRADTER